MIRRFSGHLSARWSKLSQNRGFHHLKGEHGELGECGSARPIPEHIYHPAKNGEKSTVLDNVESF